MMPSSKTLLLSSIVLLAPYLSAAAEESAHKVEAYEGRKVKVDVYEGPTDCMGPARVSEGNRISMHYTGFISEFSAAGERGKRLESSHDKGEPFEITAGVGMVIPGWDQGVLGLCVGAKAMLVIPPELAYGDDGDGADIPGGATLRFEVEVLSISEGDAQPDPGRDMFDEIDTDGDGRISREEATEHFRQMGYDLPEEFFGEEDKDGDGFVSWDEFSAPKGDDFPGGDQFDPFLEGEFLEGEGPDLGNMLADFTEIDTDGDRRISPEEAAAHFHKMGHEFPEENFRQEDRDNDGFISWDEFGGVPKGEDFNGEEDLGPFPGGDEL